MARKIMRYGYYWSTMEGDCTNYARSATSAKYMLTRSTLPTTLAYHEFTLAFCYMGHGCHRPNSPEGFKWAWLSSAKFTRRLQMGIVAF
ncbi:hypothetical protein V6N13_138318 [Hibiscus sabdariffa]